MYQLIFKFLAQYFDEKPMQYGIPWIKEKETQIFSLPLKRDGKK